MTSQQQYNNILADLFVLFDQALFRCFTDREISFDKFFGNFGRMFTRMVKIQDKYQFVEKQRLSRKLKRIPNLMKASQSQQPAAIKQDFVQNSTINISSFSPKNPDRESPKYKEFSTLRPNSQQSNNKFVIQFENGRPKTGLSRPLPSQIQQQNKVFRRSPNLTFYEQRHNSNPSKNSVSFSEPKHSVKKKNQLQIKSMQINQFSQQRNPIYQQFEKSSEPLNIDQMKIKLPSKKKLNSHRWSYKVNQLF